MDPDVPPDELVAVELLDATVELLANTEELIATELELTATLELEALEELDTAILELDALAEELAAVELELGVVLDEIVVLDVATRLDELIEFELLGVPLEEETADSPLLEEELPELETAAEVHAEPHLVIHAFTESCLLALSSHAKVLVPNVVSVARFTAVPLPQENSSATERHVPRTERTCLR